MSSLIAECEQLGADFMFYTYSAHPLACAIADKVLEIMEREHLVERAAELGARLGAQIKEELSGHPMVGDIRGAGMFWGIELVRDRATRTPYEPEPARHHPGAGRRDRARPVRLSFDGHGRARLAVMP